MMRRLLSTSLNANSLARSRVSMACRGRASSTANSGREDRDANLRRDVRLLGNTLGDIIRLHDPEVFQSVELLRAKGREWRKGKERAPEFDAMVKEIEGYDMQKLLTVSRAFTHFLALSNSAENHHRIRRLRARMMETETALSPKEDSCTGTVRRLIADNGKSKGEVYTALCNQSVEIVLTAHPTEVNRRTMLQKHQRISEALEGLDRVDLSPYEQRNCTNALKREISSIWETDELKRSKPTPVDEAIAGLHVVQDVLWHAVPDFLRKLDDVCRTDLGKALPLTVAPVKLASWMGGDRDGNPNVTPEITRRVSFISRHMAATLFLNDIRQLKAQLSMKRATSDVMAVAGASSIEPYRSILSNLENRLEETVIWAKSGGNAVVIEKNILTHTSQLMDPLKIMHASLVSIGRPEIADGILTDTIRRLAAFGLALMPLDLRQESTRHSEALDAITNYLGIGSYLAWDEETRRQWLCQEISSKRPLLPKGISIKKLGFSPTVTDTLETFELIAQLTPGSLGAYVISQCQQASDVLAVTMLQLDAGVQEPMRVVPLFETLDDLQRSPDTVRNLFSMSIYKEQIQGKQEIMVGYSDSAKDAGRLAASWAQYVCQESMAKIAEDNNVEMTFFHGKGGTVGRGGNPALFRAILAHPPDTINGRFRITEQGEMITQNFGQRNIAQRTLDLFTAGVLAEKFEKRPAPKQEWRDAMERLGNISCDKYRQIVRQDPRFVPYFRAATPELELSGLNVGSRPAKRNPKGGVESLRAIPWVFAWTQTRLNLPAWLGVGTAISSEMQNKQYHANIQEMYQKWPWFHTLVDLLEMILVKSDIKIAENYDKKLVNDVISLELGAELRLLMVEASDAVLQVSGNPHLQSANHVLLHSMEVRNPYIDALNVIQAELLKRARAEGHTVEEQRILSDALLITINGIAAGMRNSG